MKFAGLKEYVYHEIKQRLINNEIKPGERIWEEEIAAELEVSRTPVREAINRLIAEEFVENRPRKGIFAAEISKEELRKMLDVRIALESLSVSQCCKLISEEEKDELRAIFGDYKRKMEEGEYEKASQLDSKMHRFIAKIADNKKLEAYINDIQDFFAYSRPYTVKWTEAKIKRAINDHKELIDALCNGNEERAIEIIREDIEAMRDLLKDNNE
ncbi:MAG TPA: GntR family transcriptional regulator [Defluviitaleaceae bacterium]|nr:GntR family transcriptional regulator [Candidatus Epulonipiscium sp.]HOQ17311.1 GntR family transcriptional regulator [Defluviitaleaceae bacterium]HPT76396.1 GntR family transcriptional regulator [Defluviitaleaceae bacterium]HQD49612.1 GntR family transcriptional regulator [Defluviitaleaceae bacterium]